MKNSFLDKKAKSCKELLGEYKFDVNSRQTGKLLCFMLGDKQKFCLDNDFPEGEITIYNSTKPFNRHGKKYLIGRVEPRKTEDSKVMFFEKTKDHWETVSGAPIFHLQDPFIIEDVQGWTVIGGVKVKFLKNGEVKFRTVFYRYKGCVRELVLDGGEIALPFAVGPEQMKDIRLLELANGNVGVFTRPSGGEFGGGKIGFIEIKSLDELEKAISKAKIIEGQFSDGEWGGANELHLLANGKIGVLGHIAHFEGEKRHYYAMSFIFDPENWITSPIRILTTADQFPAVESKNSSLGKIIFSGGLVRKEDGTASLYTGVGDMRVGKITIPDPFLPYEFSNS